MGDLLAQRVGLPTDMDRSFDGVNSAAPLLSTVLWRRRWSVIVCIGLCLAGAGVYLALATPVYQATAHVTVEQNAPRISGDLPGSVSQSEGFLQTQADTFQSAAILRRALDSVHYQDMRTFAAATGDPVGWLKRSGVLDIEVSRKSDVITVSMQSPYPVEAAAVANAVVAAYVAEQSQNRRASGAQIIRALLEQRDQMQEKHDARMQKMVALKRENRVLSFSDDPHVNPVLERAATLATLLQNAEVATLDLKAQRDALQNAMKDPSALAAFVESQQLKIKESGDREFDELRSQFGQASMGLTMGQQIQGPNNPHVKALQVVTGFLQQKVTEKEQAMARAQLMAVSTQLEAAESKERDLREALRVQQDHALALDPTAVEYAQLSADAQQLQKQLDAIDARVAEVSVNTMSGSNLSVRTIDPARAEDRPVKPGRTLTLIAALLAGSMLGMTVALVREQRDSRLHNPDEILARLGIPVIATVPPINPRLSPITRGRVVGLDAQSMVAEAYRSIRTSLHLGVATARTILVSSPAQGDGKSTTASNLAIAFAQAGERTLLLDCDLRQPVQHMIFEMDASTGLTAAMSGEAKLSEAIRPTCIPGLHLLACGSVPDNPSEILGCKSFTSLMRVLVRTFDRIVIDSPPLIRFTDASILAASADVTLLVLRMNQSMLPLSELAIGRLEHVGARVLGAIANGGPSDGAAYYGRSWHYAGHSTPGRVMHSAWSLSDPEVESSPPASDLPAKEIPDRLVLPNQVAKGVFSISDADWSAEPG